MILNDVPVRVELGKFEKRALDPAADCRTVASSLLIDRELKSQRACEGLILYSSLFQLCVTGRPRSIAQCQMLSFLAAGIWIVQLCRLYFSVVTNNGSPGQHMTAHVHIYIDSEASRYICTCRLSNSGNPIAIRNRHPIYVTCTICLGLQSA